MYWKARAHLHRTGKGRGRGNLLHEHGLQAVAHGQLHGVAGAIAQLLHDGCCEIVEVERSQVFETDPQHAGTELVITVRGPFEKIQVLERLDQPEDRGTWNAERLADFRRPQGALPPVKQLQQAQAALQPRHEVTRSSFCAHRPGIPDICRRLRAISAATKTGAST